MNLASFLLLDPPIIPSSGAAEALLLKNLSERCLGFNPWAIRSFTAPPGSLPLCSGPVVAPRDIWMAPVGFPGESNFWRWAVLAGGKDQGGSPILLRLRASLWTRCNCGWSCNRPPKLFRACKCVVFGEGAAATNSSRSCGTTSCSLLGG